MASKLTDIEIDDYQRQGHQLYHQKRYRAALQRFNAIIQQDRKPSLNILDNRAATYAKLGNLQAALRDGRSMIEDYKTNCPGYLRTGKILQLLRQDEAAISIYKYGLRNVPSADPNRDLIRGMYDNLVKRRSPSKAFDPLLVLPVEIAKAVFDYLRFKQMVNATRVSQSWRALLHSMPDFWTHLDFSATYRNVPVATVAAYIKRSRGRVRNATISGFSPSQSVVLKCIANRCKALARLQVCHGIMGASLIEAAPALKSLETLIVGADISLDTVTQLLDECRGLRKAEFSSVTARSSAQWTGDFSQLHSLAIDAKIGSQTKAALLEISTLISRIGNIRELKLRYWDSSGSQYPPQAPDFSSLTHLEDLSLVFLNPLQFPRLPRSIKSLDVSGWCRCHPSISREFWSSTSLDELVSLSMSGFVLLSTAFLFALLAPNKGNLRRLDISGTDVDLGKLVAAGYLSGVTELSLNMTHTGDETLEILAANLPHLTTLSLHTTRVTGVGIRALTKKLGKQLERLNLNYCEFVSVDAAVYARSLGIEVSSVLVNTNLRRPRTQEL